MKVTASKRSAPRPQAVAVLMLVMSLVSVSKVWAALRYDVTYTGVLSAMKTLDIADAVLSTKTSVGEGLQRTELNISSSGHAAVESVYPFRYRLRSLHYDDGKGAIAFELYKRTRRTKQRVFFADPASQRLMSYRRRGDGPELPATVATALGVASPAQRRYGNGLQLPLTHLFDRLSLLQHLGSLPLGLNREFRLSVTDGDETFDYRVKVDTQETLQATGRSWDTWRLRLDATDSDGQPAHRPVYLWVADAERTLIKAEARHPIGRFSVSLAETDAQTLGAEHLSWSASEAGQTDIDINQYLQDN